MGSVFEGILRVGGGGRSSRYKPYGLFNHGGHETKKNAFKNPSFLVSLAARCRH